MRFVSRAGFVMSTVWAAAFGLMLSSARVADARPEYKKGFDEKYKEYYEKASTKTACEFCHPKGDKKKRIEYGMSFGETLGATKVKDMKKIEEALGKIEEMASPVKDKKFIDLIKEGKNPSGIGS